MQNVTAVKEVVCKDIAISCPYYNLGIRPKKFVFIHHTTLLTVFVSGLHVYTDNMMCNLALELAIQLYSTVENWSYGICVGDN